MFTVFAHLGICVACDGCSIFTPIIIDSSFEKLRAVTMKEGLIPESSTDEKKDANTCMALGAGVGVLGAASALLTGALCPLCIFIAPGLVGYGAYRRWKADSKKEEDPK